MIVIIDIIGANIKSLCAALDRIKLNYKIYSSADDLFNADYVVLAGVGSAKRAMQALVSHKLVDIIKNLQVPVLGICVGMQILFDYSEESGDYLAKKNKDLYNTQPPIIKCLGIISGHVKKLKPVANLSVPHSGWNKLLVCSNSNSNSNTNNNIYSNKFIKHSHKLQDSLVNQYVYFVHSYYVCAKSCENSELYVDYGVKICALARWKNFVGVQFHPEKSAEPGLNFLQEFFAK